MKVRFHNNSIRLRLSQSEVAELSSGGEVEERFEFANNSMLAFSLESGASEAALFENSAVRVIAPRDWIASDREGIEFQCGPMKVVIEKDYQCLHGEGPEDADAFPNPMVDKF